MTATVLSATRISPGAEKISTVAGREFGAL
jgi:hypothetical protein